jgi:hypothetical protein
LRLLIKTALNFDQCLAARDNEPLANAVTKRSTFFHVIYEEQHSVGASVHQITYVDRCASIMSLIIIITTTTTTSPYFREEELLRRTKAGSCCCGVVNPLHWV